VWRIARVSRETENAMRKYQRIAVTALFVVCLALDWTLYAQIRDHDAQPQQVNIRGLSAQELQLLRQDIREKKQKLIAENLAMTESEAVKFWPVYGKYSNDLRDINDEKFAMLHSYAQNWRNMSNHDSLIFMRRWLEVDQKVVQLRSQYLPMVSDALPGKKAATFFQLDERIGMMIDLEFASQLPLLHDVRAQGESSSRKP
jgi:hypothetical protein